jgi:cytochrome c556
MNRLLNVLWAIVIIAAATPLGARADDRDIIDYRQHIMNTLNEQAAALGMILSTAISDDNAIDHIEAIALSAKIALKAFEPKVQGGQAKPEVWTNWADFSKRMNDFAHKSGELTKLAREKGKAAALASILDGLPCKSCHELYRNEEKK